MPATKTRSPIQSHRGWLAVWGVMVLLYTLAFAATSMDLDLPGDTDDSRWAVVQTSLTQPLAVMRLWVTVGQDEHAMHISDRVPMLLLAAGLLLSAWALGSLGLRFLGVGPLARLDRWVLALACGLQGQSLLVLILGLCGWLDAVVLLLLGLGILTAAVLAEISALRDAPSLPAVSESSPALGTPGWLAVGLVAVPVAGFLLLGSMLPPRNFDVREYHLQAPKEFYREGRITGLEHNVYANMPLGLSMPALAGMTLVDDWRLGGQAGKTLVGLVGLLTVLAVFVVGRDLASPAVGGLAAATLLGIPWLGQISTTGLVEVASGLYGLLAFWTLWRARTAPENRWRWLIVAGVLAGGALGLKYTNAVLIVLPLALWTAWPWASDRAQRWWRQGLPVAVFLAVALASGGLWYAKNVAFFGNPVYPLATQVFGSGAMDPEAQHRWQAAHARGPVNLTEGMNAVSGFLLDSRWQGLALVPLLLALLFLSSWPRWLVALLIGAGVYLLGWWLLTHRVDRFWVPVLPLLAVAAGFMAVELAQRGWWQRGIVVAVLVVGLLWHAVVLNVLGENTNAFFVPLDQHWEQRTDIYHRWLNQQTQPDGSVLFVGSAEVYDLEPPVWYATVFDRPMIQRLVGDQSPDEARRRLRDRGIVYVLVDWRWIRLYRQPDNYGYSDFVRPQLFDELVDTGVLVREDLPEDWGSAEIYRVVDPGE